MTRQYKSMREELLKKVNALEDTIMMYKDKLEAAKAAKDDMERKKDQKIALKEAEILEQKNKMEEMAHEFGQMLKVREREGKRRDEESGNTQQCLTYISFCFPLFPFRSKPWTK